MVEGPLHVFCQLPLARARATTFVFPATVMGPV